MHTSWVIRTPAIAPTRIAGERLTPSIGATFKEGPRDERERRERDPRGRLLLDHAAAASRPPRGHLHPRGLDRWGERHPDRGEQLRSCRGGRGHLRSGPPLLS